MIMGYGSWGNSSISGTIAAVSGSIGSSDYKGHAIQGESSQAIIGMLEQYKLMKESMPRIKLVRRINKPSDTE